MMVVAEKKTETMLTQTSREEAEEIQDLINTLDPYEKREFIGFIRGAKLRFPICGALYLVIRYFNFFRANAQKVSALALDD